MIFNNRNNSTTNQSALVARHRASKIQIKDTHMNNNGLTSTLGLINGNGLTDGNGLTINLIPNNNNKYNNSQKNHRVKQLIIKNQRRNWLKVIIIIIFIILPLLIYMVEFNDKESNIQIDGEFQDWENNKVTQYIDTDESSIMNPSTNLIDCRIHHKKNKLDFYIQAEWEVFGSSEPNAWNNDESYKLEMFIDHDLSTQTGYLINNLGADERVELQGQYGVINIANSYIFDNEKENLDWNGWVRGPNVDVAKEKFRLEGTHYLQGNEDVKNTNDFNQLEIVENINPGEYQARDKILSKGKNKHQLGVVIQMMDSDGNCDLTDTILTNSDHWQKLQIIDISTDNILPSDNNVPIMGLKFLPNNNKKFDESEYNLELESISWALDISNIHFSSSDLCDFGEISLFTDKNENWKIDSYDEQIDNFIIDYSSQNRFTLEFSPPLLVPGNREIVYIMTYNPKFSTQDNVLFKVALTPIDIKASNTILTEIPQDSNDFISIYLGAVPEGITIDGIFSDWYNSSQLIQDFDLPLIPGHDVDRDLSEVGIDFNSNNSQLSLYLSVHGNLLKGIDVPPIFHSDVISLPEKSISQPSYDSLVKLKSIKNHELIETLPKQIVGTDKISIFLDTDLNELTGYNQAWLDVGAEYLLSITGHNGVIRSQDLLEYRKVDDGGWTWVKITEIPACKSHYQLETQIDWQAHNLKGIKEVNVAFFISDWTGSNCDEKSINFNEDIEHNNNLFNNAVFNSLTQNNTGSRGNTVNATQSGDQTTKFPNQRKLVRDIMGYWYTFWVDSTGVIKAKRSADTLGQDWSSSEVILAGASNCVINNAIYDSFDPSIDIYLEPSINKNEIHFVWGMLNGSKISLCYSKCINITDNNKFSNPNNWRTADNSTIGYDVIDNHIDNGSMILNNYGTASIAVDRFNRPHIVWQYEYTDNDYYINYTRYDNSNGWHNGNSNPTRITSLISDHRMPCMDVGFNGTIHVAYVFYSGTYTIKYRQCWNLTNSMNLNYWGNAARTQGSEDTALGGTSFDLNEPSLVCDTQGRVWIVTSEAFNWDIWHTAEDFQDTTYWPGPFLVTSSGENYYPTIGYDTYGTVYCVWQHKIAANNYCINMTTNSSSSWSAENILDSGSKFIYPQIAKNISGFSNLVGVVYKDDTNFEVTFQSIPEFSDLLHFMSIILILQVFIMITGKRKIFKIKVWS